MNDTPWLSRKQAEQMVWPTLAHQRRDFFTLEPLLARAWAIEWREPLLAAVYKNPEVQFETNRGGWIPLTATVLELQGEVASDVFYRNQCRVEGNFEEADLIRRVIEGGSAELQDFSTGTLWIFGKGIIWW